MVSPRPETVVLLDVDPDLAALVEGSPNAGSARERVVTAVRHLAPGSQWNAHDAAEQPHRHVGFMVIEGLLAREVAVLGRHCVELLGPGDVLRPWAWTEEGSHVKAEIAWHVLEATRMAILDHAFLVRSAPWPQIGSVLAGRSIRRAHVLAVHLAIAHHRSVRLRLLLTLWHIAERWGKVAPDGILIPLPLPHQRLADLVGASRPPVTMALRGLSRDGELARRENGDWVLTGAPPPEWEGHRLG